MKVACVYGLRLNVLLYRLFILYSYFVNTVDVNIYISLCERVDGLVVFVSQRLVTRKLINILKHTVCVDSLCALDEIISQSMHLSFSIPLYNLSAQEAGKTHQYYTEHISPLFP